MITKPLKLSCKLEASTPNSKSTIICSRILRTISSGFCYSLEKEKKKKLKEKRSSTVSRSSECMYRKSSFRNDNSDDYPVDRYQKEAKTLLKTAKLGKNTIWLKQLISSTTEF